MSYASEVAESPAGHAPPAGSFFGIRLSFTQGFLAGQLSVVIIALIAIRYIIFEDSKAARSKPRSSRVRTTSQGDARRKGRKDGGDANVANVMADILNKVHYEIDSHSGESIDWVNVVFGQALAGYREDILAGGWSAEREIQVDGIQRTARDWMEEMLNARTVGRGMDFLDPIEVTHVTFGDAYPILTNARVRPADDTGRLRVEVDIDYSDCISLSIETKLVINLPRPRFAVLPISLGLTIERFSGTLAIELFSSEESLVLPTSSLKAPPRSRHELHFSLHPDFALDASATSLVGSRAKLQDVPKIEQLLVERLRSFVHDRFVWPKYWSLTLPNLVPRRDGQEKEDDERGGRRGLMHIAGQGDVLEEEEDEEPTLRREGPLLDFPTQGHSNNNGFMDRNSAAPFLGSMQAAPYNNNDFRSRRSDAAPSLPGTLPSVEAWRSHGAASGLHHRPSSRQGQSFRGPPAHTPQYD